MKFQDRTTSRAAWSHSFAAITVFALCLTGCSGESENVPSTAAPVTPPAEVMMEGETWKLLPELPADTAQQMGEFFANHPGMVDNAVASGDPHVYESPNEKIRCVWLDQWPETQEWVFVEQKGRGWQSQSGQGSLFE